MEKLDIAICDDELEALQAIIKEVNKNFGRYKMEILVEGFLSASDLQKKMVDKKYTVYFLDIDMPEMNGIDLAYAIQKKQKEVILIFVSAREEYVFQSFRVHPFSFVRKQNFKEDLEQTVHDIYENFRVREEEQFCEIEDELGHVFYGKLSEILYLEVKDKYVQIVMENGEKLIRSSLKDQEKRLEEYGFIRCHKSFLVNLQKIYAVKHDKVILTDKREIPLKRGQASELKKRICNYL